MTQQAVAAPRGNALFITCFAALVATAFCFVLRAFVIDDWGHEFGLSATQKGELLGVGLWPFSISIVLLSLLIDRVGFRAVLWFAVACHLIGIIEAMGGRAVSKRESDGRKAIAPGGFIIHEIGGAIMGADPKTSVVNQWCQSWDVKNLFLTDGAPFPSNADKNPTLTIMALAWRSADYMLDAMKKREL